MTPFIPFTSTVIPLAMKDVDTDMIIPARFLTQITSDGFGPHLFANLKNHDSHFVFNQTKYQGAEILLSLTNFGCGSSREHAVWAIAQSGIKAIIAESFSDIFYNNAQKNGLLLITLPQSEIATLFAKTEQALLSLTIDLADQVVNTLDGKSFPFSYDPFRKTCLLNGYDDLDYLLEALPEIKAFKEKEHYFTR